MYVLERLAAHTPGLQRHWTRYALCGRRAPLERVLQGSQPAEDWRVTYLPGSVQAACQSWRERSGALASLRAG